MTLTVAQRRAVELIRQAGGYVPLVGWGDSRSPAGIDPRTVEALCAKGVLETVEDDAELSIAGVRLTEQWRKETP